VDPKEGAIRELYQARARQDWETVAALLADDVAWHEPGDQDFSGDSRGRDAVLALMRKLDVVTQGTFELEPEAFVNAVAHSAALVRWSAERDGKRTAGSEIAVFRFRDDQIAEVWFYVDADDETAVSSVFAFD